MFVKSCHELSVIYDCGSVTSVTSNTCPLPWGRQSKIAEGQKEVVDPDSLRRRMDAHSSLTMRTRKDQGGDWSDGLRERRNRARSASNPSMTRSRYEHRGGGRVATGWTIVRTRSPARGLRQETGTLCIVAPTKSQTLSQTPNKP